MVAHVLRNACGVTSNPSRFSSCDDHRGQFVSRAPRSPTNISASDSPGSSWCNSAIACRDRGMTWASLTRRAFGRVSFLRGPGIVQTLSLTSAHVAPQTSSRRAPVSNMNRAAAPCPRESNTRNRRPTSPRARISCVGLPCAGASSGSPFAISPRLAAQRTRGRKHAATLSAEAFDRHASIASCNSDERTSIADRERWSTKTRSTNARAAALERNAEPGPCS
jgi:hypothetical protein